MLWQARYVFLNEYVTQTIQMLFQENQKPMNYINSGTNIAVFITLFIQILIKNRRVYISSLNCSINPN